ncbi:MAG: GGDEF-domain containing protein, partial [Shewanella sp.]
MVILEFIGVLLAIALIAVLSLLRRKSKALRQQQQFLAQLYPQLERQKTDRSPLNIPVVPQEFARLYHSLNEMLVALPAGMGKDK